MGKGGKAASAAEEAAELLASEQFRPFQGDSFDAALFASRSLSESHTTAAAQTEALQAGVAALDGALRGLVLRHQDELVAQTARLAEAESAVQRLSLSVRSLQMVAARVRADIAEPYAQIAARTRQLRNLQVTGSHGGGFSGVARVLPRFSSYLARGPWRRRRPGKVHVSLHACPSTGLWCCRRRWTCCVKSYTA